MDAAPTHQHYVPQFILRGFASGRNKQIYVFDKATERSFRTSIRNVASVSGFYDFELKGQAKSLDPVLQQLEEVTPGIVRKILQDLSVRSITTDEREVLALFVAVQMLRTDAQRNLFRDFYYKLKNTLLEDGADLERVKGFQLMTEEELRVGSILMLPELARDLAPHFLTKTWLLFRTVAQRAFYISDNPITMFNTVNQDPDRGTRGLAVPGVEVYFPLSGTLTLGFLCPSLQEMIRNGQEKARRLNAPISFEKWVKAFDGDVPFAMPMESVVHQNSLQVANAERYVFSATPDFDLALEMVHSNPELKEGPRLTIV